MKKAQQSSKKKFTSIGIIMTYNSANLVEKAYRSIPKGSLDKIIITDDGSTDDTEKVAKKFKIPFYTHAHSGYGGNLKYGIKKAMELGADYMVEIHGDGQYDNAAIPAGIKKISSGYDFLIGSRFTTLSQALVEDRMPLYRYLAAFGLSIISRIVLQVNLTEVHSGFRMYSRNLFETIGFKNTSNDHIYSFENLTQAKYCNMPITEIPVHCNFAQAHTSMSMIKSTVYSFGLFRVMKEYVLAKAGMKRRLFLYPKNKIRRNNLAPVITKAKSTAV